jgi:dipeptidyl aminopeptidase/acylaminoacyl peptidase
LTFDAGLQADPTFSPDGRSIAYTSNRSGKLRHLEAADWTGGEPSLVMDTTGWDDKPRWSDDGRLLYFLSARSGTFNVWAIPFDPERGRPIGPPFQITRFSEPDASIAGLDELGSAELGVAGRRLAVPLQHLTGAVWMLQDASGPDR